MERSKGKSTLIVILIILAVVVWGLAAAGWIENSFKGFELPKLHSEAPPQEQSLGAEPVPTEAFQPNDTAAPTNQQQAIDASGTWDVHFRRDYFIAYEGTWENFGMEEVFLQMEIYPGTQFECDIMPLEAYINGEQYFESLAMEPQLYTGELVGNTLRLYLDLDNFYLDYSAEVTDTIQPDYIEIPLTEQGGSLSGSYAYTWVVNIEGDDLQSQVSLEIAKRSQ